MLGSNHLIFMGARMKFEKNRQDRRNEKKKRQDETLAKKKKSGRQFR